MKKVILVFISVMLFGLIGKAQITTGVYVIESAHFTKMALSGNKDGSVDLKNSTSNPNQKWQITDLGGGFYRMEFIALGSKSLSYNSVQKEAEVNAGKNAVPLALRQTNSAENAQGWQFVNNGDGTYTIVNQRRNNLVLDAAATRTGVAQLWLKKGSSNQKWILIKK